MTDITELMRDVYYGSKTSPPTAPVLDATTINKELSGGDAYTEADLKIKAIATLQQWLETDDLDDSEGAADRLMAMIVGVADANKDGEIDEDEQSVIDVVLNAIWDYLEQYSVDEADISSLLNDWDNDVADRVRDLLSASIPDGDSDIDDFVFGGDQGAVFDAVYKKKMAVRDGKKVRINKRISGTVRLSARQKVSIRKAQMKSHSAAAMMRRAKSMRIREKSGL